MAVKHAPSKDKEARVLKLAAIAAMKHAGLSIRT